MPITTVLAWSPVGPGWGVGGAVGHLVNPAVGRCKRGLAVFNIANVLPSSIAGRRPSSSWP